MFSLLRASSRLTAVLLVFVIIAISTPVILSQPAKDVVFQEIPTLTPEEKIGVNVVEALNGEGEAFVVVALVPPPAAQTQPIDLAVLMAEIGEAQSRVLAGVGTADFAVKDTFQAVPALTGFLRSESGLSQLAAHPEVMGIDLDVGGQGDLDVSVPLIGADDQHTLGVTGDGVVVAVLDTGLDTDHSDLSGDLIHRACFLDNDGSINGVGLCPNGSDRQVGSGAAEDMAGHGTHVSGIITSDGVVSSVGAAPDAEIVAIKVLDDTPFSGIFYFFSEIVAALDYIIVNRPDVKVINMSLGTSALFAGDCDNSTAYNMAGAAAINTLRASGVIAFASSGNNSSGVNMTSPACLSNVISVGATNDSDVVAAFTNSNSVTDIMAPGVGIISDAIGNGTTSASGTSMASPHAAGCAALLIQSGEATTPAQIELRLETSTILVTDPTNGLTFPRIDCHPMAATPTPTNTASITPTPTASMTPTPSLTPSATAGTPLPPTITVTPDGSPTITLTPSATAGTPLPPTITVTPHGSPTVTPTTAVTPTSTSIPLPMFDLFLPLIIGDDNS
jgi:subtilisin family serine protease